jgi:hypothetical protein
MIKPTVLLLFVFGIAGYGFLSQYPSQAHGLKRSTGYHTFFVTTAFGLVLFAFSAILYAIIYKVGTSFGVGFDLGRWILEDAFFLDQPVQTDIALVDISFLAIAIGWVAPYFLYTDSERINRCKRALMWVIKSNLITRAPYCLVANTVNKIKSRHSQNMTHAYLKDSESTEISRLLAMSLDHRLPILFTMSDNKVFVGFPLHIPLKSHNDIYILPVVSGFRCTKTCKFEKVTEYMPVIDMLVEKKKAEFKRVVTTKGESEQAVDAFVSENPDLFTRDEQWRKFSVALPCREIIHAHLHDLELEQVFKKLE